MRTVARAIGARSFARATTPKIARFAAVTNVVSRRVTLVMAISTATVESPFCTWRSSIVNPMRRAIRV